MIRSAARQAMYAAGYRSATQLAREYARRYGQPVCAETIRSAIRGGGGRTTERTALRLGAMLDCNPLVFALRRGTELPTETR